MAACSKPAGLGLSGPDGPADGPASIELPQIEISTAPGEIAKGEALFASKGCTACHKIGGGKLVGPDLQGVTKRRTLKWTARMILKPEVMLREDAVAKELLKSHMTPMANQNVNPQTELPALMAFLHSKQ